MSVIQVKCIYPHFGQFLKQRKLFRLKMETPLNRVLRITGGLGNTLYFSWQQLGTGINMFLVTGVCCLGNSVQFGHLRPMPTCCAILTNLLVHTFVIDRCDLTDWLSC